MKTLRLLPLSLAIGTWLALPAQAQSLEDLYQAAKAYDTTYQSAKHLYDATLAKGEQAQAGLLPSVSLSSAINRTNLDSDLSSLQRGYGNQGVTLSASQPLYRPANVATAEQGKKQAALAQAQLDAAIEDLIIRVSQAYFDVLAAQDTLNFVKAQKSAISEQLASAKRNFEVGTSTITDTREAQAQTDLILAQEIAADNDLHVKKLALDQLTGLSAAPKPLLLPAPLPVLAPNNVTPWVADSEDLHPSIRQARLALEVAQLDTQIAQAGNKPTLDLTGSYAVTHNDGTSSLASDYHTKVATIGLSLNLPLFSGYSVQNRIKETVALEEKSRTDLDTARRTVAQATRSAFFSVQSGLAQVKAYEAAEVSGQSSLDATKLGYQVGVRVNIDVLNAQTTLFDTKTKLAKARYDVLLGNLKLRQANGSLKEDDINAVNALLAR
jgi:outer membrane protein